MAVGTTALTCYQGEDVSWSITVSDANVVSVAGWTVHLIIKASAAALDPPLIGPVICSITDTLTALAETNIDLEPGTYRYSFRRVDSGFSWELATGALTVLDTPAID